MKKIILLILIILGVSGCYDYQELNNRAIISGISIDYEEQQFTVNFEILSTKKSEDKNGETNKSYLVEGIGTNLSEAFQNASVKINKEVYYAHLKVLVLSEITATEKLKEVIDFILREPTIRNIFYPVIAREVKAGEILKTKSEANPIVSEMIEGMIDYNKQNENISIATDFEKFMDLYEDDKISPSLSVIAKIEEELTLDGIAVFKDQKLSKILPQQDAAIYNVLNNQSTNHLTKTKCPNGKDNYIFINLYQSKKTDFEITEETIKIKSDLSASVVEDNCGYNFRDNTIYEPLSKAVSETVKKEYETFLKDIKEANSDILGFQKKYYQQKRTDLPNWQELKLEMEVKIVINKNGLIFEVNAND